jgi:hypothetical protein
VIRHESRWSSRFSVLARNTLKRELQRNATPERHGGRSLQLRVTEGWRGVDQCVEIERIDGRGAGVG